MVLRSFIKRKNMLVVRGNGQMTNSGMEIPSPQDDMSPSLSSSEFKKKKPKKTNSKNKGSKQKLHKEATAVAVATVLDANKYGYGDATPDTDKYGYGDAAPDTDKYGYGDATPDSNNDMYGYGDAAPDERSGSRSTSARTPRRSSMKTSESRTQRRRASIGYNEEKVEVRLPGDRKVKRRTSITFNEQVQVRPVQPVTQIGQPGEEVQREQLWFQDEEYDQMKNKMARLVNQVEKHGMDGFYNQRSGGKKIPCIRGLERMIGENKYASWERKQQGWDAVLWEQHYQREGQEEFNENAMAAPYMESSEESRRKAIEQAARDEEDIRQYTKSMRRACRRMSC